jgi:two-component system, LuxR family, sensor kinase FixL
MNSCDRPESVSLALDLPDVLGDRVQLQQVLLNLILNAMEAMGSITGRARVLTIRSERREAPEIAAIGVRDTGVGFDARTGERLLDAFFTTKPEGMGMGLSICRTIISAHGGRLSYANNEDHGATFEFTLPSVCRGAAGRRNSDGVTPGRRTEDLRTRPFS